MRPRYLFDHFCERLAANAERAVVEARQELKRPLRQIVFWKDSSETLIPQEVALFTSASARYTDADLVVPLARPRTSVPGHVDHAKEDGWNDVLDVYRQLLSRELHRTFAAVLPKEKVARSFASPDGFERVTPPARADDRHLARALAAAGFDATSARALASRCFAERAAQSWLVTLAPKKTSRARARGG